MSSLLQRLRWRYAFSRWRRSMEREHLTSVHPPDIVAIVLSFLRPQNIDPIVRSLLRTPSVKRVIVSNNNPAIDLTRWLRTDDKRVILLRQNEPTASHVRFAIAREQKDAELFLAVDDDIFLLPSQMEMICNALRDDSSCPHGMFGSVFDPAKKTFAHGIVQSGTVDVLSRVYAFHRNHVEKFFQWMDALRISSTHELWRSSIWDDLVLSHAGEKKPLVHDVGPFIDCPSSGEEGIAVWRQEGFFDDRARIFQELRSLRPL